VNIPVGDLAGRLSEVPKDKPIAIYCHVGGRASRAAALLRENGYTQPIEYGGIVAWKDKGYAVAYPAKASGAAK
jgi:rhodanese-related sulfurtransferase